MNTKEKIQKKNVLSFFIFAFFVIENFKIENACCPFFVLFCFFFALILKWNMEKRHMAHMIWGVLNFTTNIFEKGNPQNFLAVNS